jgi:putative transposase
MSRPLRIEFPGAVYHITTRGNEKKRVFLDDGDRAVFLAILKQVRERFGWLIHSYVLMDNHYHLLVETVEANLSRGMRQLNGIYTRSFNQRHVRVGHLFQGRFKAILVEKESYLLELSRYIVLNPVRAGMVGKAEEWPWSSYRALIGMEPAPPWLTTDWILEQYGRSRKSATTAFRRYVEKGVGGEFPDEDVQAGLVLGNERYIGKIQGLIEKKREEAEIPRKQRRAAQEVLDDLFLKGARQGKSRDELIYVAYVQCRYTMKEIGDYLGMHYVNVSRAISRHERKNRTL